MQFPINLNLTDRPVLVVGGGRIAHRKVQQLLACDADVTVLAPLVTEELERLNVRVLRREYATGDVEGFRLVITATGNVDVDQRIFDEAEERGIWVNSADDPERCTFTLPAVHRQGPVMVTVSTGGASPALSSWMRANLARLIGPEFAELAAELASRRTSIHAVGFSTEDVDWEPIIRVLAQRKGISFDGADTSANTPRSQLEMAR